MQLHDDQVTTAEVNGWRGLHLLHFRASSCSQKVRILLADKNIARESHPVDLARKSPADLDSFANSGVPDPKRDEEVRWHRDYARQGVVADQARASLAAFAAEASAHTASTDLLVRVERILHNAAGNDLGPGSVRGQGTPRRPAPGGDRVDVARLDHGDQTRDRHSARRKHLKGGRRPREAGAGEGTEHGSAALPVARQPGNPALRHAPPMPPAARPAASVAPHRLQPATSGEQRYCGDICQAPPPSQALVATSTAVWRHRRRGRRSCTD